MRVEVSILAGHSNVARTYMEMHPIAYYRGCAFIERRGGWKKQEGDKKSMLRERTKKSSKEKVNLSGLPAVKSPCRPYW